MIGTGVSGWRRPGFPDTGPAVTLATFPHLGQARAPPSKEKTQPQKRATSVITGTFFLCAPAAAVRPASDSRGTGALLH